MNHRGTEDTERKDGRALMGRRPTEMHFLFKEKHMRFLAITFLMLAIACGGETNDGHEGHAMPATTKVVKADGVQAAFDLMTADEHEKMIEMMQVDMEQTPGTDHHVSVTLMDLETKKVITDAQSVKISVTGPNGSVLAEGSGHVMEGGGMYHHGLDFVKGGAGEYVVKIEFVRDGEEFVRSTKFTM